jgi:hypothetical protein
MNNQLGGSVGASTPSFQQPSHLTYTTPNETDYRSDVPFFNRMNTETGASRGWKPPNIRYRHIEDFKKPEYELPPPPIVPQDRQKRTL